MPSSEYRIVLDTNIVVRAFINPRSASGQVLKACEQRRVVPLLSRAVLDEYRVILADPALIARYPQLDRSEVALALQRLIYVGDFYRRIRTRFVFPRDPKDSHLIELSIAGGATHLISTDRDLLSLPAGQDEASRRFRQRLPRTKVHMPEEFLEAHGADLGMGDG